LPPGLRLYLVPAEREQSDNSLRFFETAVATDGTFAIGNIAVAADGGGQFRGQFCTDGASGQVGDVTIALGNDSQAYLEFVVPDYGNIGTFGISYPGFTQILPAPLRSPYVKALVPVAHKVLARKRELKYDVQPEWLVLGVTDSRGSFGASLDYLAHRPPAIVPFAASFAVSVVR